MLRLIVSALGLTLIAPLAGVIGTPPAAGPVLVIVMPGQDAARIVAAAGGRGIGPVGAPFAVLAQSDAPGFADRLIWAGAWAIADGRPALSFCGAGA